MSVKSGFNAHKIYQGSQIMINKLTMIYKPVAKHLTCIYVIIRLVYRSSLTYLSQFGYPDKFWAC